MTAEDTNNNTVTGYTGTVTFSSSDSNHQLPSNATLTDGTGVFAAILRTPGNQTITAADTTNGTLTSASNTITVASASATHFAITAPASTVPGAGFTFTVTAEDQFNNNRPRVTPVRCRSASSDSAASFLPGQQHVGGRRGHLHGHAQDGGQSNLVGDRQ